MGLSVFVPQAFSQGKMAKKSNSAALKKDELIVGGFLVKSSDKRYVIVDSGSTIYYLKRQESFLKNQLEFRKPEKTWLNLRVKKEDIVKQLPSKSKKFAEEAI